ncbi:MAG TPA: hypothetical protein VF395_13265, partial [Polyangiaceae bacterium]
MKLSVPTLAWAALTTKSKPLTVRLYDVSLQHVEVFLADDGTGAPTLAETFQPKKPSPPSSGPGTVVLLDRVVVHHVWAHGSFGGSPPVDAELKDALGSLRSDAKETAIAFSRVGIQARGLPRGVDPVGQLAGVLSIPAAPDKPLSAHAHYQGQAAGVPLAVNASYVDSKILATLRAATIPP